MLWHTVSSASHRGIILRSIHSHTRFTRSLPISSGTSGNSSWASITSLFLFSFAATQQAASVSVSLAHTTSSFVRSSRSSSRTLYSA